MAEQDYFKKALSNFTYDMACGDAIRYMTGQGYSVKQIMERLDFPTPIERVRQMVWKCLLDNGVLLLEEPGTAKKAQVEYVRTYDKYGKASFIQVTVPGSGREAIQFVDKDYCTAKNGSLDTYIEKLCRKNGEDASYISCDFGLRSRRDPAGYRAMLQFLSERQQEYIQGLPWERRVVYHRLDHRMKEIIVRLCEAGEYRGVCYFLKSKDKIKIL